MGTLTPVGCCHHPPAQAGSGAKLAAGPGRGCRSGGTCARAFPCPRTHGRGCTSPGVLLRWVLAQAWARGQRCCPTHAGGWEPCYSTGCCIPWRRLCSGHGRDGHGVLHPQGAGTAGLGAASQSWQRPSSCAMTLVAAPAHGLTLTLFLLHQPQGPGHQPAWDCAQRQDAAVRVTLAWHAASRGSGVHPGQALTVPLSPLTSSCPVMLVVGDNAPAEEGVVSDGVVPAGWHTDSAHTWARSCSQPAQTCVSSCVRERAHVQTYLLVWARVHVHLCMAATPGKPPLPHTPRRAHNVHTRMCQHTGTLPAWPHAPKQLLAHACACTHPHDCPHLHNQPQVECRWPHLHIMCTCVHTPCPPAHVSLCVCT